MLQYPKREQSLFIYLFLEMVHNKNKYSKLPAKPSDSWISSDLWLEIAFSIVIFKTQLEVKDIWSDE